MSDAAAIFQHSAAQQRTRLAGPLSGRRLSHRPPPENARSQIVNIQLIKRSHGTKSLFHCLWVLTILGSPPDMLIGAIVNTCPNAQLVAPPASVRQGQFSHNDRISVFNEQQDVLLAGPVTVDARDPGTYDQNSDLVSFVIPAGTRVSSHYIHYDSQAVFGHASSGCVTFDQPIIGVVERDSNLNITNTLGAQGVDYPGFLSDRGFELGAGADDRFTITSDRRTLIIDRVWTLAGVDDLRVITCEDDAIASFTLPAQASFCEPIWLDGSDSWSEIDYFLEVFETDSVCNDQVVGAYWSGWFPGPVGLINLRDHFDFPVPGIYRVKLAVTNDCTDWNEAVQCITIPLGIDCNNNGVPDECESVLDILGGEIDDCALPLDDAQPGSELLAYFATLTNDIREFDDASGDKLFGHTFEGLSGVLGSIELEIHLKAVTECCYGPQNDIIALQRGASGFSWSRRIGTEPGIPGLLNHEWDYGSDDVILLDLTQLPMVDGTTIDLRSQIQADGRLDVYVQDDTGVDYIRLIISNDCNANGVPDDCELNREMLEGVHDDFALPVENVNPGPELQIHLDTLAAGPRDFDQAGCDEAFGHTITGIPATFSDLTLEIHLKSSCAGSQNDAISLQYAGPSFLWGHRIGTEDGIPGLVDDRWLNGSDEVIELNLKALPVSGGAFFDLTQQIRATGRLDVYVQDDTAVDYIRLWIDNDCNANGIPDDCELCSCANGDMNGDGTVNGLDLQVFLNAYLGFGTSYEICAGDFDGSAFLDAGDVAAFVGVLIGC